MEYLIAHIGHTHKHSEHVHWWKPKSAGYTICIDKAGRYSAEEAAEICARSNGVCIAVTPEGVEPLALSTPYYRLPNGTLAAMYDGGPHRPVPNSHEAWGALLRPSPFGLAQQRTESPRPIGRRATAIYLDPPPKP